MEASSKDRSAEAAFAMESSNQLWLERLFPPHFSKVDFFSGSHQPEPLICEKFALERARRTEQIYNKTAKASFHEDQQFQRKGSPSKLLVSEQELNLWGRKREREKIQDFRVSAIGEWWSFSDGRNWLRGNWVFPPWRRWGPARNPRWRKPGNVGFGRAPGEPPLLAGNPILGLRSEVGKGCYCGSEGKNISLKIQVSLLKAELVELKAKYKTLVAESEQAMQELSDYRTEAWCKTGWLEQIQRQRFERDSKIEVFKQGLLEKSDSIRSLKEELKQRRGEVTHLKLQKKDLQEELEEFRERQDFQNKLLTENMKLCHDMEMRKIQKELEDAKGELDAEKALNTKSAKDLEMLKIHLKIHMIYFKI
uniref:coiled-coil domain-containing protein 160 homolog n=1 Tax=Podarcis muralis TaxID=64176 RepID=UPI0010A06BF9|nr:coiled-coil domain-containing protein 160 homolog [Podarcis muralis]